MKLLILDENYPHLNNLLGDVFVHVRVKEYAKKHEVKIFSFFYSEEALEYEGIDIQKFSDVNTLVDAVKTYAPDKILIHFYNSWMFERLIKVFAVPLVIWVHGYEALGWYRRLYNYTWYSPVLLKYIVRNTKQQYHFRQLIKYANRSEQISFIFVSNWMRKITERDTLTRVARYSVIPNPIDCRLFRFIEKKAGDRNKVLILRSFNTKKYANDIAVKAILELSKRNCFSNFYFTVAGDGSLFERTLEPLKGIPNITIKKGIVRHSEIPAIHARHGLFLCPTRQDAQGVSMCEAMASGLVPLTSNNTAIPEFVKHGITGYLTASAIQLADAMEELHLKPDKFLSISAAASVSMQEECGIEKIVERELKIIES